jgi:hypothetical protein
MREAIPPPQYVFIAQEQLYFKTIVLPLIMFGCKTWTLALNSPILRVSENEVLREIFGTRRKDHDVENYIIRISCFMLFAKY